jgi:fluoride exporter
MLSDPNFRAPIAISLGAIAGALSRYYLTLWFTQTFGSGFPYGTFFINLSGCVGMGVMATLAIERVGGIPPEIRLLIAVGFLGSYTTFSTYGLDSVNLLRSALGVAFSFRNLALVAFYWAGSALLGAVGVWVGMLLAQKLP